MFELRREFAELLGLSERIANRDARLLARVLASAMLLTVFTGALAWVVSGEPSALYVFSLALLMQLPPWLLLRRGRVKPAAALLCALMWLFFATFSLVQGGLESEQIFGHLLVMILAVLLIGARAGLLFTLLSIGWQVFLGFGLTHLNSIYLLIPREYWPRWASTSVFLLMGYILLVLTYRNLQAALAESRQLEERYRSLFEQSNDAIFIRGLELPFRTYANPRAASLLGYSLEELAERSLADLAAPEEQADDSAMLERLLAGEDLPPYERRLRCSTGGILLTEIRASLVRDGNGRPMYLQSIVRDITDRKRTETRLREIERRYQALFESTNDGVFLLELDLSIAGINLQGASMLGYAPDEMLGRPVAEYVAPEERHQPANVRDVLLGGQVMPIYERTFIRGDGSRLTAEVSTGLVYDDQGRPLYIQSIVRDITWRKKLEDQLTNSLVETEVLARTDSLTGLMNRRAVEEYAEAQINRAYRESTALSVVMLDMDQLKEINDTYGHQSGDEALKLFAELLMSRKRAYDCAGRWAGDEFVLVLPGAHLDEAQAMADRLAETMRSRPLQIGDKPIHLQASVGVATLPLKGKPVRLDDLVRWADAALYRAKQAGRGQVRVHLPQGE